MDVHHIAPRADGGEHSRGNCVCLCTTHHALLHEGRLRIEGDADGELMFHDATGAPLSSVGASHRGTGGGPGASHRGTAAGPVASHGGRAAATGVGEEAAALLAVMGTRGGWTVDALVDASGLRVSAVQHALLCLELDGHVACEGLGSYARCAPPGPHQLRSHR